MRASFWCIFLSLIIAMPCKANVACGWHPGLHATCDTLAALPLEYCRSRNAEAMLYYKMGYYELAVDCFRELLDDYPPAMTNMGIAYMNGTGVKQNEEKAFDCFLKAAGMGEPTAQQHLGAMYALGIHVEQSDSLSYYWFMSAAELGNTKAMNMLGNIYLNGKYVSADADEALKWFRRSALAGDIDGLYEYGLQLVKRDPGYKDQELGTGYNCIYSAAKNGHALSQKLLMYDALREGNDQAVFWWAKALHKSGDHEGTKVLGDCYRYGHGVSRSKHVARKLYRMAADKGNEDARKILEKW